MCGLIACLRMALMHRVAVASSGAGRRGSQRSAIASGQHATSLLNVESFAEPVNAQVVGSEWQAVSPGESLGRGYCSDSTRATHLVSSQHHCTPTRTDACRMPVCAQPRRRPLFRPAWLLACCIISLRSFCMRVSSTRRIRSQGARPETGHLKHLYQKPPTRRARSLPQRPTHETTGTACH